jgi:hypothetical protein
MKRQLLPLFALLALTGTIVARPQEEGRSTRVLFLGNSYTGTNDLPSVFQALAASGGRTVVEDRNTPGGKTLGSELFDVPHMSDRDSLGKIAAGGWNFVVLQDHSIMGMVDHTANTFMQPAVLSLDGAIDASNPGAITLLYQTWARRDPGSYCFGQWCSPTFADFHAGQDMISHSYAQAATPIGATVVPVGEAWRLFRTENPTQELFASDGTHPNMSGTYLAACTFYAAIFGASPVGLSYIAELEPAKAALLQDIAARTWFADAPFCDGSDGSLAACPCANPGDPGSGCDISQGTGGVHLSVAEQTTAPVNRVTLSGSGFPVASSPTVVVIRGDQREPSPVVFGDGLRCIGVPLVRFAATVSSSGASSHVVGHGATAGSGAFHYQLWFRNTPATFCQPGAFNLSNGRTLQW